MLFPIFILLKLGEEPNTRSISDCLKFGFPIETSFKLHIAKASSPISVTELGMVMFFKLVQAAKARYFILVTELGIVISLKK